MVTLFHPSSTRMHTWPWAAWTALLWLLPVALLGVQLARGSRWRLPGRLVTGGLALLLVATVAAAWASPFSMASLARTWPTLGGVALIFLLHQWLTEAPTTRSERSRRIAQAIAWSGAALVVVSLGGWLYISWPTPWLYRNEVPFGHSNYTGGLIVLLFPWFILRTIAGKGTARAGWLALDLLALFALAGTSSRGAVLALGATAGAAIVFAIAVGPWTMQRKLLMAAAALVVVAGAVLANPRLRELVVHRTWSESARESNRQRSAMIEAGLELGRQRPVLGWGPGSVPLAYPRVRAGLDGGVENILQLHATPLQVWATLGGVGLLALGLLVAGAGIAIFRALRSPERSPPLLAAAASLTGYAIFTLTDHQLDLPVVVALVAFALALLTSRDEPDREWSLATWPRIVALVHVLALLGGPLYALGRDLLARRTYEQGVVAWENQDPSGFLKALDRAATLTPYDPFFQHHAANQFLGAREHMPDAASRRELTRAAADKLEASLQTKVHEELAHFNLGWLKLDQDDPAAAARHFIAAARLVPDKGGVYFGLGLALQAAGKTEGAVRAFALEWINDPRSLTSPAWEISVLAALRPAVQAETLKLYAQLRAQDPRAATAEAWTRWWLGETVPPVALLPAFNEDARDFVAAQTAIAARIPLTNAPWARLYSAWLQPEAPESWQQIAPRDPAFAAALQRRAVAQRADFRAFLGAPIGEEPTLARTYRRQRSGYGVLALHPDGPPIMDVYIVQENRIVADFAAGLFPPKGWLPGRFLLALLPSNPR